MEVDIKKKMCFLAMFFVENLNLSSNPMKINIKFAGHFYNHLQLYKLLMLVLNLWFILKGKQFALTPTTIMILIHRISPQYYSSSVSSRPLVT